jgi:hypothetical protein
VTDASTGDPVEWRLDFVKPDKLHIARMVKDTTDEWVKIGPMRFYSAPPSLSTSSSEWETAEKALLAETALDTLRRLTPISGSSYRIEGKRFLRLVYQDGFHVWIDLSTNRLSKTEEISKTTSVQHAFTAFDEAIVIAEPSNGVLPFHP